MALTQTYRGFSTIDAERTRNWTRYDVDLVKRDLLNHFMTRIGERLGRLDFGCRIWDWLHEQMTPDLRERIIEEAIRIVKSDPRVNLVNVNIFEFQNGIRVELTLDFIGLAVMDTFSVDFDQRENAAYNQVL